MNTIPYVQGDPRWGAKRLGATQLTMASHGCYVTVIASILAGTYDKRSPLGGPLTPGDLCDQLNATPGGFDSEGQLGWTSIHALYPDAFLYGRVWTTNAAYSNTARVTVDKAIRDMRRAMLLGFTVGICVDLVGSDKVPDHIVACEEMPEDLSQLLVMDPAYGDIRLFSDRYGDPLKGIMGYRLLVGDRANKPYSSDQKVTVDGSFLNSVIAATWKASQLYQGIGMETYAKEILDSVMGG